MSSRNLGIELLQKNKEGPLLLISSDPDDLLIMLAKSHLVFPTPGSTIPVFVFDEQRQHGFEHSEGHRRSRPHFISMFLRHTN